MGRMLRNLVGVKPDVRNDDLKRYVSVADSWVSSGRGVGRNLFDQCQIAACAVDLGSEPPVAVG